MTLRERINRQISQMRSADQHKHDCICAECLRDWHADDSWPTLLREFPKGTVFYQPMQDDAAAWALCGCNSVGPVRVCQPGDEPSDVVCKAWIAFRMGAKIAKDLPVAPFSFRPTSPGSYSVH